MMEGLDKDILKVIKEQMPGMFAEQLSQYIKNAEDDKKKLVELQSNNKTLVTMVDEKRSECYNLDKKVKEWESRSVSLEKRELDVRVKEEWLKKAEFEVEMLRMKLSEAEKRVDLMKDMYTGVFKNTIFKETVMSSVVTPHVDYNSYYENGNTRHEPTCQRTVTTPVITETKKEFE